MVIVPVLDDIVAMADDGRNVRSMLPLMAISDGTPNFLPRPLDFYGAHLEIELPTFPGAEITLSQILLHGGSVY